MSSLMRGIKNKKNRPRWILKSCTFRLELLAFSSKLQNAELILKRKSFKDLCDEETLIKLVLVNFYLKLDINCSVLAHFMSDIWAAWLILDSGRAELIRHLYPCSAQWRSEGFGVIICFWRVRIGSTLCFGTIKAEPQADSQTFTDFILPLHLHQVTNSAFINTIATHRWQLIGLIATGQERVLLWLTLGLAIRHNQTCLIAFK